jgi:cell wall-associated NlpC family hydrolase
MRRPLLLLVLLATIVFARAQAVSAMVVRPAAGSKRNHAARVRLRVRKVVAFARHQLGVAYHWGGTSRRTGFDCSGLVFAAYRSVGMRIPRSTWDQLRVGRRIRFSRLRPGDLVFTNGGGHVQIVVSKRAAISAPQTGERVRYVPLRQLRADFDGARRLLGY